MEESVERRHRPAGWLNVRAGLVAFLCLVTTIASNHTLALSLDDIQLWTGSGSNRAALVIEWSTPESLTNSLVPIPRADKTLVWGYRFNGSSVGATMLR